MERLNAFTLLKSVDNGKLFQTSITLHAKKLLLGFIQLVHVATCNSAWAQLEEVLAR